jgi:NADH:ubiquinone oxidoreductase subunit 6 (subunit J)
MFNFEFLPISFLVVYAGAIAVLFLFVLMMLNIKLAELQENYSSLVPLTVIFSIIFLVEFILLFRAELPLINNVNEELFSFLFDIATTQKTNFTLLFGLAPNLKSIAMPLFADYLLCFILAGYILLLAMLAAIVLTIQKAFVSKSQNVYIQVMADYEKSIVNFF